MQAILIILGIYLLYKFMVDFVIPVYKTSKRVQDQFRNMQHRANTNANATQSTSNPVKTHSKDYIDFEEIKD